MIDDYALLGVSPSVSEDELRAAFLFLAKKFHPDANPGNEKQAAEHFKNVEAAYFRIRVRLSQTQTSERRENPPKDANSPPAAPAPTPPRPEASKSSSGAWFITLMLLLGAGGVLTVWQQSGSSSHADSVTEPPAWQRGPQPPPPTPSPPRPAGPNLDSFVKAEITGYRLDEDSSYLPVEKLDVSLTNTGSRDIDGVVIDLSFLDVFKNVVLRETITSDLPIKARGTRKAKYELSNLTPEFRATNHWRYIATVKRIAFADGEMIGDPQ